MGRSARFVGVVAVLAAAMAAITGCGSDSGAGGAAGSTAARGTGGSLVGTWDLTIYTSGGRLRGLPEGLTTEITFAATGTVNGKAAVNTYRGPFTADEAEGSLSVGPLASTQIGGRPEAMKAESDYLAALEAADSYTVVGQDLTMQDATGEPVLTFTRRVPTPFGSWEVTGFNNGREAVVSPAPGSTITADFAQTTILTGDAGVNRYRAGFELRPGGGGITIEPPVSTRKAGPPALMEQEALYLAALESAATFTLQGDVMTLRDASDAIAVTLTRS